MAAAAVPADCHICAFAAPGTSRPHTPRVIAIPTEDGALACGGEGGGVFGAKTVVSEDAGCSWRSARPGMAERTVDGGRGR